MLHYQSCIQYTSDEKSWNLWQKFIIQNLIPQKGDYRKMNEQNVTAGFNAPASLVQAKISEGKAKTEMPVWKILLLGIFAGMFIAFGASSSSLAIHAIENPGVAKLIAGLIFPVGLMMIVFVGGELFTGDYMMLMGNLHKKYNALSMIRVLVLVYLSNLVGSVIIAALVYFSGQLDMSAGLLGAFMIKVAYGKAALPFSRALFSGILCNILVCAAVLMAGAAKDIAGKVFAILFPIMAFVIGGYEHCVANMYYIPAGLMALSNDTYKQAAMNAYGYTEAQLAALSLKGFFINNLIPVTIGNIIGGMIFVSIPLYLLHKKAVHN